MQQFDPRKIGLGFLSLATFMGCGVKLYETGAVPAIPELDRFLVARNLPINAQCKALIDSGHVLEANKQILGSTLQSGVDDTVFKSSSFTTSSEKTRYQHTVATQIADTMIAIDWQNYLNRAESPLPLSAQEARSQYFEPFLAKLSQHFGDLIRQNLIFVKGQPKAPEVETAFYLFKKAYDLTRQELEYCNNIESDNIFHGLVEGRLSCRGNSSLFMLCARVEFLKIYPEAVGCLGYLSIEGHVMPCMIGRSRFMATDTSFYGGKIIISKSSPGAVPFRVTDAELDDLFYIFGGPRFYFNQSLVFQNHPEKIAEIEAREKDDTRPEWLNHARPRAGDFGYPHSRRGDFEIPTAEVLKLEYLRPQQPVYSKNTQGELVLVISKP